MGHTHVLRHGEGIGRAVCDIFDRCGFRDLIAVTITSGDAETHEGREYHVPKVHLIGRLQALLHTGELKISAALADAKALAEELRDFRLAYTMAGNVTMNARVGRHDDLLLATASAAEAKAAPD
ncbi:MAG: hypothetical protein EXQ94_13405, partial [Alphaproteobacteria bacterium]|nr:hypothetical protein [Alphaproteobacteria bacterium]